MSVQEELNTLKEEFRECEKKVLALEMISVEKLTRLETQVITISSNLNTFVNQHQFAPVKLITYGLAAGVLTTVLAAVLAKTLGI